MPWVKGQSGSPKGPGERAARSRLKSSRLREYLWKKYGVQARSLVDRLDKIAFGAHQDHNARLKALDKLLAYHSGLPVQQIQHSSPDGPVLRSIVIVPPDGATVAVAMTADRPRLRPPPPPLDPVTKRFISRRAVALPAETQGTITPIIGHEDQAKDNQVNDLQAEGESGSNGHEMTRDDTSDTQPTE